MIEPQRAPVRPRVISPESGEELPLEEVVRSFVEASENRTIRIQGNPGSVVLALRHIAAVFAGRPEVRARDETGSSIVIRSGGVGHTILDYQLAPWERDDWIEYLLAEHPDRCAAVMARLMRSAGHDLLRGSPFLWRVALDRMAADESIATVREALLRHVYSRVNDPERLSKLQATCLDLVLQPDLVRSPPKSKAALSLIQSLLEMSPAAVAHQGLRLLVAANKITTDLAAGADCLYLARLFPRDLVREAARAVAPLPEAMDHLREIVVTKGWPMAASLLHATNCGWVPDPQRLPLLAGAYLRGAAWPDAVLAGLNAKAADLAGADLRRADLTYATLAEADLAGACLQRAVLLGAVATRASLAGADLSFARANGADFGSANLHNADLDGARLAGACLELANLDGACLTDADLRRAKLPGASLTGADLGGADLTEAVLPDVKLRDCRCVGAVFAGADLRGCDLEGLELPAADFTEALLKGALLTGTLMEDGRLDRADLRNAGLAGVEWERASLRGADLAGASFHLGSSRSGLVGSPIPCEGSKTGFYTDDFTEQDFKSPEEVRKANLCFADLREAKLEGVDFYLVDLRGALLDPEQEEHVRRCGAILEARV